MIITKKARTNGRYAYTFNGNTAVIPAVEKLANEQVPFSYLAGLADVLRVVDPIRAAHTVNVTII